MYMIQTLQLQKNVFNLLICRDDDAVWLVYQIIMSITGNTVIDFSITCKTSRTDKIVMSYGLQANIYKYPHYDFFFKLKVGILQQMHAISTHYLALKL